MTSSFGPDEIGEDVVARPVAADAPFDGEAGLAHAPGAAHDRIDVDHLEGDVMQRRALAVGERDAVVIHIAIEEGERARLVDQAEAEHLAEELGRAARSRLFSTTWVILEGRSGYRRGAVMARIAGDDAERAAFGIAEREAIAAARLGDRGRLAISATPLARARA